MSQEPRAWTLQRLQFKPMNIPMVITLDGSAEIKDQEIVHVIEKSYADQLKAELEQCRADLDQSLQLEREKTIELIELKSKAEIQDLMCHEQEIARIKAELAAARAELAEIKSLDVRSCACPKYIEQIDAWRSECAKLEVALEKAQSIIVEHDCEECGTHTGVRYEIKPIVELLAQHKAFKEGMK